MSADLLVIVLSSYNGSRFIADQIDSIRRQTLRDWTLVVRDDGSSDDTAHQVESFAALDRRIELVRDDRGNVGPVASFGLLLQHAQGRGARYVALADQDDVWNPDKLARELDLLRLQEQAGGADLPVLVHSDLTVVGEDLSVIHRSFRAYQRLPDHTEARLGPLLIQNVVTGCTVLINRPLLEAALPLPAVIMHDWWLALCAAALGRLVYLPEATVLYRQHGRNVQGSQGWLAALTSAVRRPFAWWSESSSMLRRTVRQTEELRTRIERETTDRKRGYPSLAMLREFCSAFASGGGLTRLRTVYRHRIRPRTLLPYPVPFYLRVMLGPHRGTTSPTAPWPSPDGESTTRQAPG